MSLDDFIPGDVATEEEESENGISPESGSNDVLVGVIDDESSDAPDESSTSDSTTGSSDFIFTPADQSQLQEAI